MAWNRPTESGTAISRSLQKRSGDRFPTKSVIAGAVVIATVIGAACYFVFSEDEKPTVAQKDDRPSRIAGKTPAAPRKETPVATPKRRDWASISESETNKLSLMELRRWKYEHRRRPAHTNSTFKTRPRAAYAIFNHRSENVIAGYLARPAGTTLVGTPTFDQKFVNDFLESLKQPIIVSHEDPPEVQELKRLMNETKIDLKDRYDAGEDICKIMADTHRECQELGLYKAALEKELREFQRKPDVSPEDVDDFVKAANIMLDKKGIAPLTLGPITKRILMRRGKSPAENN